MSEVDLPFDRVRVGSEVYSAQEFMSLPLSQRVRHLLKREAMFFLGEAPVRPSLALGGLRAAAAGAAKT